MAEIKTSVLLLIHQGQNSEHFRELNWEGSFEEYLEIVQHNPRVTRTAFQRVYDMFLLCGKELEIGHLLSGRRPFLPCRAPAGRQTVAQGGPEILPRVCSGLPFDAFTGLPK